MKGDLMEKRLRRSVLYVPGSSEKMLSKSVGLDADALILDLEDGVAEAQKETARGQVLQALKTVDFGDKEKIVRINGLITEFGHADLQTIIEGRPDSIVIPKIYGPAEMLEVDNIVTHLEEVHGIPRGQTKLMVMVETPAAVLNLPAIATCTPRATALCFGAADFMKETGGRITGARREALFVLTQMVLAARVAGIDAIDTPHFNIKDEEGLIETTQMVRDLGFDGRCVIHPSQIGPVNRIFSPSEEEVEYAKKVIEAYKEAEATGRGTIALEGDLIEALHVEIAKRTLKIAERAGLV
jgi:citrate lyase subunit beta/citryl-CoA lyase